MRTAVLICLCCLASPLWAEERETLGYGRLFTNDYFGDGEDRWRSASYSYSFVRGYDWDGAPPPVFGDVLSYRLRSEIIAPSGGSAAPGDRPFVGLLAGGVFSHSSVGSVELTTGAEVVAIGPQTGVSEFQDWYHDLLGFSDPPFVDQQLGDDVFVGGQVELAYPIQTELGMIRPFVAAETGAETLARVGADVFIGPVGQGELLLRDPVTGQLMRGIEDGGPGVALVAGADLAQVSDSNLLPEDQATETRARARAGVHWQMAEDMSFFYGVTYLGEEFEGQDEGQTLGSLKLNFNF